MRRGSGAALADSDRALSERGLHSPIGHSFAHAALEGLWERIDKGEADLLAEAGTVGDLLDWLAGYLGCTRELIRRADEISEEAKTL